MSEIRWDLMIHDYVVSPLTRFATWLDYRTDRFIWTTDRIKIEHGFILEPCPICGRKPETLLHMWGEEIYHISCDGGDDNPPLDLPSHNLVCVADKLQTAVVAWNTRNGVMPREPSCPDKMHFFDKAGEP